MLKRYTVNGVVTISMNTEVKARSLEHAKEIANMRGVMSLCHQCASGEPKTEWVTSGEIDGDVQITAAEEACSS